MANKEWDAASIERKLEMLRKDVNDASDAHNRLAWTLVERLDRVEAELKEIRRKIEAA